MNRQQLEHALRAAGGVAATEDLVVIGSQAILGTAPDAPAELLASLEVDLYPRDAPEKADLIDGSIGELSPFHQAFGYYAHGVGPETAVLPRNWQSRLVKVANANTGGVRGWCLSPPDLALSKLAAGRPKDLDFVRTLLRARLVTASALQGLLPELPAAVAEAVRLRLTALTADL
jgi:hypothetical protein